MEHSKELPEFDDLPCKWCTCVITSAYRLMSWITKKDHQLGECTCVNHAHDIKPVVGMGTSRAIGSDRHPGTIVSVSEDLKRIGVSDCYYVRVDKNGMSESQRYKFFEISDPSRSMRMFTLRKNRRYVSRGHSMQTGQSVSIGHRDAYYDFSF